MKKTKTGDIPDSNWLILPDFWFDFYRAGHMRLVYCIVKTIVCFYLNPRISQNSLCRVFS